MYWTNIFSDFILGITLVEIIRKHRFCDKPSINWFSQNKKTKKMWMEYSSELQKWNTYRRNEHRIKEYFSSELLVYRILRNCSRYSYKSLIYWITGTWSILHQLIENSIPYPDIIFRVSYPIVNYCPVEHFSLVHPQSHSSREI